MESNKRALDEAVSILYSNLKDTIFTTMSSPEMKSMLSHYKAMREELGAADAKDYQKGLKKLGQGIQVSL